ncbi:hypothetical protein [Alkalihalobacillus sp. AL-G]|uniref:hypothetical protein n=1 Tax=Alkalihalobacillus sp. AL-G TaxID=2926399 RepID=UPI00272BD8E3|nr:hypothetical protein [Alkalihalobacillus sp. AL-G]WLD93863.1 hypothetical protein MOJ78_02800 [Alkalihalobacillus sp. AL-G]
MGSFQIGTYGKLIKGLSIAAVLAVSYGIYFEVTYQPPFLDIQVKGTEYTVFGEIGEIGYYADSLVREDKKIKIRLVTWEKINITDDGKITITINYPSGKEETWVSKVIPLENESLNHLKDEFEIKGIYELESFTFEESGDTDLTIDGDKEFEIEVK